MTQLDNLVVYVVDDDEAIRDSMKMLLGTAGLHVKLYSSAVAFLDDYDLIHTGCLVADVRMPEMSGVELQKRLADMQSPLSVILMTGQGDVAMAVAAMKNGAVDFFEKPFDDNALLERIRECMENQRQNLLRQAKAEQANQLLASLTPRERQIMELLVNGKANKTIAAELSISARTVEVHRARVMEKLNARSLADVVRIALDTDNFVS